MEPQFTEALDRDRTQLSGNEVDCEARNSAGAGFDKTVNYTSSSNTATDATFNLSHTDRPDIDSKCHNKYSRD